MTVFNRLARMIGFNSNAERAVEMKFSELILILQPGEIATLNFSRGSEVTFTGFAGTLWITGENYPTDYRLKNGQTIIMECVGQLVIQALTQTVPCKLHVVHKAAPPFFH
jgi:hypothetical protein